MARVKVCGVCWKPVAECICDDEPERSGPGPEAA
jgi:hypothetical protein